MAQTVEIGASRLSSGDVAEIARSCAIVSLSSAARERIASSHAALRALASTGTPIYGVSTGLGAAVDTRISPGDTALQERVPLARSVGVGRRADAREVRAMMAARIARLAVGRSGASLDTVSALVSLLNSEVHPIVPMTGSVGQADLAPLAHIASVLIGAGAAEYRNEVLTGAEALSRAGLERPVFGPKDGLALVSSNAASVGLGALAVVDIRQVIAGVSAATALSFEGFRANLAPLSPRALELRPVSGQAWVGESLLRALDGGDLAKPGSARRLQDPLSFRCVGPVHGACVAALVAASDATDLELNSSDDNPAILADDQTSLSNANFDSTHLALAFEGLGLALGRVAAACGERIMKLMSPEASGLPRFLSPLQEGRNGFATVQKTVSALVAEIQHRAMPMPVVLIAVADRVEDYGTMALSTVDKIREIADRLRLLAAIELMVAAQACDLRGPIVLGHGTRAIHARVRSAVAALHEDRPSTADIEALDTLIRQGAFGEAFSWPATDC